MSASTYRPLVELLRERGIPVRIGRAAAHAGELRVVVPGRRVMYSTHGWLDSWLRSRIVPASPIAERRAAAIADKIAERAERTDRREAHTSEAEAAEK